MKSGASRHTQPCVALTCQSGLSDGWPTHASIFAQRCPQSHTKSKMNNIWTRSFLKSDWTLRTNSPNLITGQICEHTYLDTLGCVRFSIPDTQGMDFAAHSHFVRAGWRVIHLHQRFSTIYPPSQIEMVWLHADLKAELAFVCDSLGSPVLSPCL